MRVIVNYRNPKLAYSIHPEPGVILGVVYSIRGAPMFYFHAV